MRNILKTSLFSISLIALSTNIAFASPENTPVDVKPAPEVTINTVSVPETVTVKPITFYMTRMPNGEIICGSH